MTWHFFPYSLQYVVGGGLSASVSGYILYKNPKSLESISFFSYGLFTTVWMFLIFLHRTAPTAELSTLFFRVGMLSLHLQLASLLMTVFCIRSPKKIYLICLGPAVVMGILEYISPVEIIWGRWGWSYRFLPSFFNMSFTSRITYSLLTCLVLSVFIKKYRLSAVRKKSEIVLGGFILYMVGMVSTNYMVSAKPNFPPFGGVLTTIFFSFVAYAASLPVEEITPPLKLRKPLQDLVNSYLRLLNAFKQRVLGKELGTSGFRFMEYIESMGLKDIVVAESGKLVFNPDKLREENIGEIPDSILRIMKEHRWAMETMNDFILVFVRTYDTLQLQSKSRANEWLEQMLQRHGGFLAKHGVLATMPRDAGIPGILKDLHGRRGYLLKEEKPEQAYKKLNEALSYGFAALCVSKLHPEKVRERYNIGKVPIFWLTFQKAERTISPKDSARLKRTISEFLKTPETSIILFDCFDQIKAANGFQKSLAIFKELMSLRGADNSIMLMSVNPHVFEEGQLEAVEKELEEAQTERA